MITSEGLEKIKEAISSGCSDEQAAIFAGVSVVEFSEYQKLNPSFLSEKQALRELPKAMARVDMFRRLKRSLVAEPDAKIDAQAATYILDRTDSEFKPKSNQDITSGGKPLPTMINIIAPKGSTDDASI